MQNTSMSQTGFWDRFAGWGRTAARWNTGRVRRSATVVLFLVALALATAVLADTTDYDVTGVSVTVGTSNPDCTYDYVLNDTGGPPSGQESGHMSSIKLSDGGTPATAYPSEGGCDGNLPGDLFPGDVVDVTMDMTAMRQGKGAPEYPVTVEMWVLSEPAPGWVGFDPTSVTYDNIGDTGSVKVTISIPEDLDKADDGHLGHVQLADDTHLDCNAGDAAGPEGSGDSTGWYDADGDTVGDYCYKVKVQARSDEPKFGNGSGIVIYFNIDPPAGCASLEYTFNEFMSPMKEDSGSYWAWKNNSNAGFPTKFRLTTADPAALADDDLSNCEFELRWGPSIGTESDAKWKDRPAGDNRFDYDPIDQIYYLDLDIVGSGMTGGESGGRTNLPHNQYTLTVYLTDGIVTTDVAVADFELHVGGRQQDH